MGAKKVVLVEDNAEIRLILSEALQPEFDVLLAANGKDGLDVLRHAEPHDIGLILLDAQMPVMNGREMLNEMKCDSSLAGIPVVIISAHARKSDFPEARQFLSKPFDFSDLLAAVERYCGLQSP